MSTDNICFHGVLRKNLHTFVRKKEPYLSGAMYIDTDLIKIILLQALSQNPYLLAKRL